MRDAMKQQRVKPGVTQHNLEPGAGRRVAGQCRINLVAQVSQEHRRHYVMIAGLCRWDVVGGSCPPDQRRVGENRLAGEDGVQNDDIINRAIPSSILPTCYLDV